MGLFRMGLFRRHIAAHFGGGRSIPPRTRLALLGLLGAVLFAGLTSRSVAQEIPTSARASQATASLANGSAAATPIRITLAEAEQRARKIEPTLQAAFAARGTARYNRSIARSLLLPQGNILGEYLFTQSNRSTVGGFLPNTSGPVFIANNGVHEYTSQAVATETLSVANVARYRQTGALALQARAQAEIALRGLHVVVTQAYYAVESAERKLQAARQAQQAAQNFLDLTMKLEAGREVAHADVLKAQLQLQQAQRGVADAESLELQARQSLGVLLFPNPATPYVLADPLDTDPGRTGIQVPDEGDVRAMASRSNPDLRSAIEALRAANADVIASRAGYLPSFSLAYNYGLDAPAFETTGPDGIKFLGYSASAAMNIPVWDWFATHGHVKQSELLRNQSRIALDYTQRQLIAQLNSSFSELRTAAVNLASLQRSAQDSRESLRLTMLQYQAGQAIVLEVVAAENAVVAAETAAADGALRYHVARANLERLTGVLP
jgi:outer membrane protein